MNRDLQELHAAEASLVERLNHAHRNTARASYIDDFPELVEIRAAIARAQAQGLEIACMLAVAVRAATSDKDRRRVFKSEAKRVRLSADIMKGRAGCIGIANAYYAAADFLEALTS